MKEMRNVNEEMKKWRGLRSLIFHFSFRTQSVISHFSLLIYK